VWRDRDVVSFAQSGNLLELGNATRPGDIRHDVVGELALEDWHEIPLRMPALAPRDGGIDLIAHLLEGVEALWGTWLLEPVDLPGFLEAPAETNGGRDVEAAVRIDENLDIGPRRFADQGGELGRLALVLAGHAAVEIPISPFAGH